MRARMRMMPHSTAWPEPLMASVMVKDGHMLARVLVLPMLALCVRPCNKLPIPMSDFHSRLLARFLADNAVDPECPEPCSSCVARSLARPFFHLCIARLWCSIALSCYQPCFPCASLPPARRTLTPMLRAFLLRAAPAMKTRSVTLMRAAAGTAYVGQRSCFPLESCFVLCPLAIAGGTAYAYACSTAEFL